MKTLMIGLVGLIFLFSFSFSGCYTAVTIPSHEGETYESYDSTVSQVSQSATQLGFWYYPSPNYWSYQYPYYGYGRGYWWNGWLGGSYPLYSGYGFANGWLWWNGWPVAYGYGYGYGYDGYGYGYGYGYPYGYGDNHNWFDQNRWRTRNFGATRGSGLRGTGRAGPGSNSSFVGERASRQGSTRSGFSSPSWGRTKERARAVEVAKPSRPSRPSGAGTTRVSPQKSSDRSRSGTVRQQPRAQPQKPEIRSPQQKPRDERNRQRDYRNYSPGHPSGDSRSTSNHPIYSPPSYPSSNGRSYSPPPTNSGRSGQSAPSRSSGSRSSGLSRGRR